MYFIKAVIKIKIRGDNMTYANRRDFMKKSTVTAAAALVSGPMIETARAKNKANDTINVAVVGIRNRGIAHIREFIEIPNVRVAALCDVDERLFPKAIEEVVQKGGKKPKPLLILENC